MPVSVRRLAVRVALPVAIVLAGTLAVPPAERPEARSFRTFDAIATPTRLPDGARPVERLVPIDGQLVERAVRQIVEAWNTGALGPLLDDDFVSRRRLLDTLVRTAPQDAQLRVLSVRSHQTLEQMRVEDDGGPAVVSTVAAVVETQVLFNDPVTGFQRLPGTNEFLLQFREPLR